MVAINRSLFKKYDIRGYASGDKLNLTPDVATVIGQAIGTFLQRQPEPITRVVTGRDNRHTSPALHVALNSGLKASGMAVLDIGLVSTPLVYWYAVNEGDIGGVMVTGSHLTPEYNGVKMSIGAVNIYGDEIQTLAGMIENDDLMTGDGKIDIAHDVYTPYWTDITDRIKVDKQFKLVIDPGNGTGGLIAPRLLELWGQEYSAIYLEPDGDFPNHLANPQNANTLRDLGQKVVETGAAAGIAFDGDADRMGAVDERGQPISADRILALLARDMLSRNAGADVVGDVLCSQTLFDVVKSAAGVPSMAASGHSLVKEAMRERGALIGGEMSGHLFFSEDYFGYDDGFFAMGRLLQVMSKSDRTLSQLDDEMPRYVSTPEYRPHCPDELKAEVIAHVQAKLEDQGEIVDVDGVRVQFERGWGILRASNTEPVLSLRFEGLTEDDALAYRALFIDALADYPQINVLGG